MRFKLQVENQRSSHCSQNLDDGDMVAPKVLFNSETRVLNTREREERRVEVLNMKCFGNGYQHWVLNAMAKTIVFWNECTRTF